MRLSVNLYKSVVDLKSRYKQKDRPTGTAGQPYNFPMA